MAIKLGIVIPCYNEEQVIPETAQRVREVLGRLIVANKISEVSTVYFVDDGSTDRTWRRIVDLANQSREVSGIKLARNRGHQNALLAGLFTADGEALISMDADLQDDINVIEEMVDRHHQGVDIVYGVRKRRASDTRVKRLSAQVFYRMMAFMGAETIHDHADFRLMSRRAIDALKQFREVNLFLRGIVPLIGYRSAVAYYDRGERFAGESKYPLRKMVAFAVDGITSFSIVPLRCITLIGFVFFLTALALSGWALWIRLFTDRAVPGWTSIAVPTFFLGGVQILCIGVIGEYLGKIYVETKGRPRYIIETIVGPTS